MTDAIAVDFITHLKNGKDAKGITIDDLWPPWPEFEDTWPRRDFIKADFSIHALNDGNYAIFCNSIGGAAVHPDAIRMVTYIDIELKTQRLYERSEAEKLLKTP